MSSYNWSHIDEEAMKKADPEKYRRWRIAQIISTDFLEEKLDRNEVKAVWPQIKHEIDPWTRRAVEYILWGHRYSLQDNTPWWNNRFGVKKSLTGTI